MKSDTQNSANITIADFCDIHDACDEGRKWALSTGMTTMSEIWNHPELTHEWKIWIFCRKGVTSERNQRLFAVWSARQVQPLITDPRSIAAIDVAERFANGQATSEELAAAWGAAAYSAVYSTARSAAYSAAYYAAYSAARVAALEVAWEAASAAAKHAASAAARVAARHATAERSAAMEKQAAYLTEIFPTWESLTK